jgi:hypothetical protein
MRLSDLQPLVQTAHGALDRLESPQGGASPGVRPSPRPEVAGIEHEDAPEAQKVTSVAAQNALLRKEAARADIEKLIRLAMSGSLPRSRPLRDWEPAKLNAQHIQMVLMKAAGGITQNTIAEVLNVTPANVSVVLNHPDAKFLLARLASHSAGDVIDIEARIQQVMPEMLEIVIDAAREAEEPTQRAKIAFGLLDRGGYGAKQKVDHTHEFVMPKKQADLLLAAIDESDDEGVQEADYVVINETPPQESDEQSDEAAA